MREPAMAIEGRLDVVVRVEVVEVKRGTVTLRVDGQTVGPFGAGNTVTVRAPITIEEVTS